MKTITTLCALFLLVFFCFASYAQTYCTSKGTSTTHGYIKKVSMETINNTSGNNGGYADFTSLSATLQKGATYTVALTPGFSSVISVAYWTVYIDYNHDGVFEANELVSEKHSSITEHGSFTIPVAALSGRTRMRIQMQAGAQETNPCAVYTYGETEDYSVILVNHIDRLENPVTASSSGNPEGFNVYPNPAKDNVNIEFTGNTVGNVNVNIYNMAGQKIMAIQNHYCPTVNIGNSLK